jgi:hypothetical protein
VPVAAGAADAGLHEIRGERHPALLATKSGNDLSSGQTALAESHSSTAQCGTKSKPSSVSDSYAALNKLFLPLQHFKLIGA